MFEIYTKFETVSKLKMHFQFSLLTISRQNIQRVWMNLKRCHMSWWWVSHNFHLLEKMICNATKINIVSYFILLTFLLIRRFFSIIVSWHYFLRYCKEFQLRKLMIQKLDLFFCFLEVPITFASLEFGVLWVPFVPIMFFFLEGCWESSGTFLNIYTMLIPPFLISVFLSEKRKTGGHEMYLSCNTRTQLLRNEKCEQIHSSELF